MTCAHLIPWLGRPCILAQGTGHQSHALFLLVRSYSIPGSQESGGFVPGGAGACCKGEMAMH